MDDCNRSRPTDRNRIRWPQSGQRADLPNIGISVPIWRMAIHLLLCWSVRLALAGSGPGFHSRHSVPTSTLGRWREAVPGYLYGKHSKKGFRRETNQIFSQVVGFFLFESYAANETENPLVKNIHFRAGVVGYSDQFLLLRRTQRDHHQSAALRTKCARLYRDRGQFFFISTTSSALKLG